MLKRNVLIALCCLLSSVSAACAVSSTKSTERSAPTDPVNQSLAERPGVTPIAVEQLPDLVMGQVVYVPIYSEIYDSDPNQTFQLAATLSLRNTDLDSPIIIETLDYYDSGGAKISTYLRTPIQLAPLASFEIVVARKDSSGGSGANFIVEWRANETVSEPIVEAIMISSASQQGMSFVSPGRIIQERQPDDSL
ncbi:MAG: DUF3124 domain-containing protein [Thainema sp.]